MAAASRLADPLDRFYTALEEEDVEAAMRIVEAIASPAISFTSIIGSAVEGRAYEGFDGVRVWLGDLTGTFAVSYDDRDFRVVGDRVVVSLAQLTLKGKGSEAEVVQQVATLFELDSEGRIVRGATYPTHAEALERAEAIDA